MEKILKKKFISFIINILKIHLTPKQLDKIIKQVDKKDWGYKCKDQPMCSFVINPNVELENMVLERVMLLPILIMYFSMVMMLILFIMMTVNGEHKLVVN
jgi:hypothetical protein